MDEERAEERMAEGEEFPREGISERAAPFLIGLVIVSLIFGGFYLLMRFSGQSQTVAEKPLPFGVAEQGYVGSIHFENLGMSAYENMFHQQVTYVNGDIADEGPKTIRAMDVTVEFRDEGNKVVLRETRRIIGAANGSASGAEPLGTGDRRNFQLGFDTIPVGWNHQFPTIRITGLDLE